MGYQQYVKNREGKLQFHGEGTINAMEAKTMTPPKCKRSIFENQREKSVSLSLSNQPRFYSPQPNRKRFITPSLKNLTSSNTLNSLDLKENTKQLPNIVTLTGENPKTSDLNYGNQKPPKIPILPYVNEKLKTQGFVNKK